MKVPPHYLRHPSQFELTNDEALAMARIELLARLKGLRGTISIYEKRISRYEAQPNLRQLIAPHRAALDSTQYQHDKLLAVYHQLRKCQ